MNPQMFENPPFEISVLVVDDSPEICELISVALDNYVSGRVLVAYDGLEAKQVLTDSQVDLLITDLNMPRLRGDDLGDWYQGRNPAGKVLIISSFPARVRLHADWIFLQKPFTMQELRASVANAKNLGGSKLTGDSSVLGDKAVA